MSEIIRHLIIKRSQGLSKVLNGNKVGFSLWWVLLLKRKRTYSMQVMGIDGPVVLIHGNRQPRQAEVRTAPCSQRQENLRFHFSSQRPRRGPHQGVMDETTAWPGSFGPGSLFLLKRASQPFCGFYQLVEFVFGGSSSPGMKQSPSDFAHHLSSVGERWYDLFTCNEAWPYFSRDFLKGGMCQLTDLSPRMKPQQIFSSPPASLPPGSSVTICASC